MLIVVLSLLLSPFLSVQILGTLCSGGTLMPVPDEARVLPRQLLAWFHDNKVVSSFVSTAMCESMVQLHHPPGMAMRSLIVGGDVLHHGAHRSAPYDLINVYGPTEATVFITSQKVRMQRVL